MVELFRFRCATCGKLLGVPPHKAGRAVHCPKCGVELVVPHPGDDPDDDEGGDGSREGAVDLGDLGIDLGFHSDAPLGLRPAPAGPEPPARPAADALAIDFLQSVANTPPPPDPASAEDDDFEEDAEPLVATPVEPLVAASKRRAGREASAIDRRRDVVLPRTAAVAWSLFALLALGLAFVAGLMVGHYRWR